jgi:adenine deaminase
MTPFQFARAVVPGNNISRADPHEIGTFLGMKGLDIVQGESRVQLDIKSRFFVRARNAVETSGARLTAEILRNLSGDQICC